MKSHISVSCSLAMGHGQSWKLWQWCKALSTKPGSARTVSRSCWAQVYIQHPVLLWAWDALHKQTQLPCWRPVTTLFLQRTKRNVLFYLWTVRNSLFFLSWCLGQHGKAPYRHQSRTRTLWVRSSHTGKWCVNSGPTTVGYALSREELALVFWLGVHQNPALDL